MKKLSLIVGGVLLALLLGLSAMSNNTPTVVAQVGTTCVSHWDLWVERRDAEDFGELFVALDALWDAQGGQNGGSWVTGETIPYGVWLWSDLGPVRPDGLIEILILPNSNLGVFETTIEITNAPGAGRFLFVCEDHPEVIPTATPANTATNTPSPTTTAVPPTATNTPSPTTTAVLPTATNTPVPGATATITPYPLPSSTPAPILSEPLKQSSAWFYWVAQEAEGSFDSAVTLLDAQYDSQNEIGALRGGSLAQGLRIETGTFLWGGDFGPEWAEWPLESLVNAGGVGYFRVYHEFLVPEDVSGRYLLPLEYTFLPLIQAEKPTTPP